MIPLLLFAAMQAAAPSVEEQRFEGCVAQIGQDAAKAIDQAEQWRIAGGGVPARHCLALAYAHQQRFIPAATAFEQAAREAEKIADRRAASLWVQSGNARLAGKQPELARAAFDAALAHGTLAGAALGEVHLDRTRALVALGDQAGARADLDKALKLAPGDPLAWLLSATLARWMGDLPRAQTDIQEASKRSPDDASVAVEAGNIALVSGAPEAAKLAWEQAIRNQPGSDAAKAARIALDHLAKDTP